MTDPAIVIPLVVLSFVLLLVKTILNYRKWQLQHGRDARTAEDSLTASELKALMQEAVADATLPMAAHIEQLEARLEALARRPLPPASEAPRLRDEPEVHP
ncbi:MAG: hypothetical protein R3362_11455 [Rhodothermales bacterium]|nr:hypothetical protein [Rhodothermales bacterium]